MKHQTMQRYALVTLAAALPLMVIIFALGFQRAAAGPTPPGPRVLYVAKSGSGSDGLSWPTAFTDVQVALSVAAPGDQIWVAAGVYTPGLAVTGTFQLLSGVALYGGFDTAGANLADRDWNANPTVLSGDIAGDDAVDARGVVTTTGHINGVNNDTVVTGSGVNPAARLDGFFVTAGQSNGNGAGLYNDGGTPTIANVTFSGNLASNGSGGGAFNTNGSPALSHVTFSGNRAGFAGAGMYNSFSSPVLTNVTFYSNTAGFHGAGLYIAFSLPTLMSVTFSSNAAGSQGGGIFSSNSTPALTGVTFSANSAEYGGGMYNVGSSPVLTRATFSANSAGSRGGGMYNDHGLPKLVGATFSANSAGSSGGGMYNERSSPSLSDVDFTANTSSNIGGGMSNDGSSPTLTGVSFSGNSASIGGGMDNYSSSPTLKGVTFSGNSALGAGGAGGGLLNRVGSSPSLINVIFSGNSADIGGGIGSTFSSPVLINATFSGNAAGYSGGGMWIYSSQVVAHNTIFWENQDGAAIGTITATISLESNSSITLSHSLVQGLGGSGSGLWFGGYLDGGNNIDSDPLFETPVDPSTAPTSAGDLRLRRSSPAVDAGDNSVVTLLIDRDGSPRIVDGDGNGAAKVDMGAYEYGKHFLYLPLMIAN